MLARGIGKGIDIWIQLVFIHFNSIQLKEIDLWIFKESRKKVCLVSFSQGLEAKCEGESSFGGIGENKG